MKAYPCSTEGRLYTARTMRLTDQARRALSPPRTLRFDNDHGVTCTCFDCVMRRLKWDAG